MGSSRTDLSRLPDGARHALGYALYISQLGGKHPDAKPLRGFGGAGVLEATASVEGNAFRAIYTVHLAAAVYVLHVFQKKSKRGIRTPQREILIARERLKRAERHHAIQFE